MTITTLNEQDKKRLEIIFCGLKLNSPLVLLSGCVGFGEEYTRINGFSNTDEVLQLMDAETGKYLSTTTYILFKDRDLLRLEKIQD